MGKLSKIEKVLASLKADRAVIDLAIAKIEDICMAQAAKKKPMAMRKVKKSNAADQAIASWESVAAKGM